jgi:hypothetical protein
MTVASVVSDFLSIMADENRTLVVNVNCLFTIWRIEAGSARWNSLVDAMVELVDDRTLLRMNVTAMLRLSESQLLECVVLCFVKYSE